MSFIGGGGLGGPGGAARFAPTRGRIQGSPQSGVNYPSPFFDVAHTYLPVTIKQLFRWCRYYFLTSPLINAVAFKLSEYPITDIIIDHEDPDVVSKWSEYLQDQLSYRAFQVEVGLDYHVHGNAFISVGFPFKKFLTCPSCQWREQADKIRPHWVITNYAFRLTCPKCGSTGDALAQDVYFKNASGIRLVRWNPEDIEVTYNEISGEYTHFYTIPAAIRNDVVIGRKDIVEGIPQVFIQAMREQKGVIFSKDNFFHMRRPTLAGQDRGWGIPLLLPVLKDTFYLQLMKKSQEAVLLENMVPLRVLFPQAGSGTSDVYSSVNLVDWRDHVATEIARWRHDQNYYPILPLPIGTQTIGGDGRALLLTQEIQTWSEQIINGMQVPLEFVKGGLSFSGTSVSMRMLENAFIGYILRHKALGRFVMQQVANFLDWPMAKMRFKPFKMADDIQRKAFRLQLNQLNKISDTTLLSDDDLNSSDENQIILREAAGRLAALKEQQLGQAQIQGEAQLIMQKFQVKAQQEAAQAQQAGLAPGEPGAPTSPEEAGATPGGQGGAVDSSFYAQAQSQLGAVNKMPQNDAGQVTGLNVDLRTLAQGQANLLKSLSPQQQELALNNLRAQNPELAQMVEQLLASMQPSAGDTGGVDMRPMPEARAPRRANGMV